MKRMYVCSLAAVALAGGVGGCARPAQHAAQSARGVQNVDLAVEDVPLRVQNNTGAAVKILVVDGGMWKFVGLVEAGATGTFFLTGLDADGAPLRLLAMSLDGKREGGAGPLTVLPGQRVTFTIETDPARSFATVR